MKHPRIQKLIIAAICSAALLGASAGRAFAAEDLSIPLVSSIAGQSDIITSLSINQDGNILASGSKDGTVKLYYVNSSKTVTISAHDSNVNKVIFNPQNDTAVSCGDDGKIKFWNADTGELNNTIDDNTKVVGIEFNNDGNVLYSGDDAGSVKCWDANTGDLIYKNDFNIPVVSITLDKINNILAVALKDNSIAFIDANKKVLLKQIQNVMDTGSSISNIVYSHDGKSLVCAGSNMVQPVILSCADDYKKLTLDEGKFEYNSFTMWNDVSFSSDDHYLIGCDKNNDHVGIFNFYSGKLVKEIDVHPTSVILNNSNSELLIGNLLDNINIYDTSNLPSNDLKSVKIDAGGGYFVKSAPIALKLTGHYSDGTDRVIDNKYVQWQVSDKDASMNNGILIPKTSGSINVTASYGGVNYTIVLNVVEEKSIGYIELN
jgi:WD40 repeat protein